MARAIAVCVAALCALGAPVAASPVGDPTAGRAVFTGASVPDVTSIDVDPAAIGIAAGFQTELFVSGIGVLDQLRIHQRTFDLNTGALSPGADVSALAAGAGGTVGAIYHLPAHLTIGAELRALPPTVFPQDRPSLRYFSLGGYQREYTLQAAAAAQFGPLYIGVSVGLQKTYLRLRYARDTALAAGDGANGVNSDCGGSPCGAGNPAAAETYDIKVRSPSVVGATTANLGLVYQLMPGVFLAAAYHLPLGDQVQTELDGDATIIRPPRDGGGTVTAASTVYFTPPSGADAELRAALTDALQLHVGLRWQDLSRMASYDVRLIGPQIPGSGIPEWTERPLGYHDPVAVWAGVEQADRGAPWRIGGRIGVESGAVTPTRTQPIAIAPTSFTADLGGEVRLSSSVVLQATYGLQYFPTVHAIPSAYNPRDQLTCDASDDDYSTPACTAVRFGYATPTAAGDYDRLEHTLRLSLRVEFR